MGERNSHAKLHAIATIGFDIPAVESYIDTVQTDGRGPLIPLVDNSVKPKQPEAPQPCLMDHPKLLSRNFHFLKGIDTHHSALSQEEAFAEAVATRNNPTTLENLRTKLTCLPPNFSSFTPEQQEAFCRLVDAAEIKQTLKYELKRKEKVIRDLELKYLTTDFGLGNVVHGWDLSSPGVNYTPTDRGNHRRKIKDADRIFSASSVMSFISATRLSRAKQMESKKKKREIEKIRRLRKKQMNLQRQRLNAVREKEPDSDEESVTLGDDAYSFERALREEKRSEVPESFEKAVLKKKNFSDVKKTKYSGEREMPSSGKNFMMLTAPPTRVCKSTPVAKQEKPVIETGHRLRTLLTNKTPLPATGAFSGNGADSPAPHRDHPGSIRLKIFKSHNGIQAESSEIPPSPAASLSALDSNPETPSSLGGVSKRQRGRPKSRVAEP